MAIEMVTARGLQDQEDQCDSRSPNKVGGKAESSKWEYEKFGPTSFLAQSP